VAPATQLAAVSLQAPANAQSFSGPTAQIALKWSAASRPLAKDEYYLITIQYPHAGKTWTDYQWSKDPAFALPGYLYDLFTDTRVGTWYVTVVRLGGGEAKGDPKGRITALTPDSDKRTFVWSPADEKRQPGPSGLARPATTPAPSRAIGTGGLLTFGLLLGLATMTDGAHKLVRRRRRS
jgi:hypothetical protein